MGETIAQTDMLASNGIYADGHLSFPDEQGRIFIATFEATSSNSDYEVKYRLQKKTLFWDAIAIAALICSFTFSFVYAYKFHWIAALNGGWILSGLLFYFLIINIIYRKTLWHLPRYRAIFAIERFKQYYADEQWIALGEDVFDNSENPYYKELKKQCVFNGFGLMSVNTEGDILLHITPARAIVYGKKRPKVTFISKILENKVTQKAVTWTQGIRQNIPLDESVLMKYHSPFNRQISISIISAVLCIGIFYKFIQATTPNDMVDKATVKAIEKGEKILYPEPAAIPDSMHYVAFHKKEIAYTPTAQAPSDSNTDEQNEGIKDELTTKGGATEDGVYLNNQGQLTYYDCARLQLDGNNFIIQESVQPDLFAAQKRIAQLQQQGIAANCVWLGCFSRADLRYSVFIDLIYQNKSNISARLDAIKKSLDAKGLQSLKIVSLTQH